MNAPVIDRQQETLPDSRTLAASAYSPNLVIVTAFRELFENVALDAILLNDYEQAIAVIQGPGCDALFCDVGSLDGSGGGFRFAKRLRKAGYDRPLYLMTTEPKPHDETWAITCGATGLIRRSVAAILAVAPVSQPAAAATALQPATSGFDRLVVRVRDALKLHTGPVAQLIVEDAIGTLSRRYGFSPIPAAELVEAVALHIKDGRARAAFVQEFNHKE
ncbi:response regulator [Parachitinimonas caeni]|uniref:DUF8082 domain-containing protein n=1 Tax=Parachitinimonas caeni TaxID=3031301 RepID=A0ABT7E1E5_9NEIS|nr:hypothetical protein [Parachitinimonas caeni]MDK2125230.1 hypothetical protein [Parachitinimonas caeni]